MSTASYLLCDDLIFASRITGTARSLGFDVMQAGSVTRLQELVTATPPGCVIMDLSIAGDIHELMAWLKSNCTPPPRVVGYGSHVDVATLSAARAAGCDPVLPRSKFVEVLPAELPRWLNRSCNQVEGKE
jgi:hypothetical protein